MTRISGRAFGAVAPYVLSISGLMPSSLAPYPLPPSFLKEPQAAIHSGQREPEFPGVRNKYDLDLSRPDLAPLAIVTLSPEDVADTYESFVAAEGWREEFVLEGPFMVESEKAPTAFFDSRDLSVIGLYE